LIVDFQDCDAILRIEDGPGVAVKSVDAIRRRWRMQCKCESLRAMKTDTTLSVRVEPELRAEVESLLGEGETLSEFIEASVRSSVQR
jgi:hypothetical protein